MDTAAEIGRFPGGIRSISIEDTTIRIHSGARNGSAGQLQVAGDGMRDGQRRQALAGTDGSQRRVSSPLASSLSTSSATARPPITTLQPELIEEIVTLLRDVRDLMSEIKVSLPANGQARSSVPDLATWCSRLWSNDTGVEGKPLSLTQKETIVADCESDRQQHELVIVADETATRVFVNGSKVKAPPGKKAYKILSYVLKHKGHGGTAWNIALHVYDDDRAADLEEGKAQAATGRTSDIVNSLSRLVSRRIADVNGYLRKWNTELKADDQLHEYSLTRVPSYCLIEETGQRR